MKIRSITISTLLMTALLGFYTMNVARVWAVQEQKFKTLKLVRTYQSEEEYQRASAKLLRVKKPIVDNGESIKFIEPETGQLLTQLKKKEPEVLREEKRGEYTTVMEKTYEYQISTHQSLVMYTDEGGYVKETGANPPLLYPQPQKRILYNRKGEVITELPPMLGYIEDSPDRNYFVATYSGEGESDSLYVYDMRGHLLKKQEIKADISFQYSSNSEYVKVKKTLRSQAFGEAYLFTKTGDFVTKYDYGELHDYLFDFHVSNDGKLLLFSMFNNAYLISSEGQVIWQKPYLRIMDCRFNREKNYLILYSLIDNKPLNESRKSIKIVSLPNGELLEEMDGIELIHLTEKNFVIKREGNYYEYTVK